MIDVYQDGSKGSYKACSDRTVNDAGDARSSSPEPSASESSDDESLKELQNSGVEDTESCDGGDPVKTMEGVDKQPTKMKEIREMGKLKTQRKMAFIIQMGRTLRMATI